MKPNPIVKLPLEVISDFKMATFQNAKRLLVEAEYIFHKNFFQTSAFLSISSIEEMGKFYLGRILSIKSQQNKLTQKDLKDLIRHPKKQLNSFLPPFPFQDKVKISKNISKLWDLVADKKLMPTRNNCLYVGIDETNACVFSPEKEITKEEALYFLETAFEIIILQIDSQLSSLDCDHNFPVLIRDKQLLQEKLNLLKIDYT